MTKVNDETHKIILEMANIINNGICNLDDLPELKKRNGKFQKGMSFVIHHHRYLKKNGIITEKIYSDFIKDKTKKTLSPTERLAYHKYLKKQVKKNPKRFKVFHNKCHYAVESVARYKPERRKRLFKMGNEIYKNNYS